MLRPTVLDLVLLPSELRQLNQWVVWRLEQREGKQTKVPYQAASPDHKASATDSSTWASFDQALQAVEAGQVDGLGFVFAEDDPFCGIDLDAAGTEEQRSALLGLHSYTERSVSGQGLHIILRASLNGWPRNRSGPLEVYDQARFFVMTGDHLPGTPERVEERQAELEALLVAYLPTPVAPAPARPAQPVDLDDQELLGKAFGAHNGSDLRDLWDGHWEHRYGSQSEADLALCCHLAFWWGRDPERMDRMFRSSGLYREKWERQDYRERTMQRAIEGTQEVYDPHLQNGVRPSSALDSEADSGGLPGASGGERSYGVSPIGLRTPTPMPHRESHGEAERSQEPDSEAADPGSGSPFSLPARDFIERERRQAKALLTDEEDRAVLAAFSLILVGALGGHGKTTLTNQLVLHLVAGVDFPPFTVPHPISVLVIENEGPEELFAEKLGAQLAAFPHELKGRLDICTVDWGSFSLSDQELRKRLTTETRDKGYDLIVGDPLDSLGIQGVGSPEDTRAFMALMKETGLHKTVAWWLNTHPRKQETKEALDEIAGAWGGKPDTVLLLTRLEGDRTRVRFPKLRWAKRGTRPSILLAFDPDTEAFTFIGEETEEQRDYLGEIRALLGDGTLRLVKEIAAKKDEGGAGINDRTVKKVLTEHPEVFVMQTGDAARALGRKPNAELWGLLSESAEPAQTDLLAELPEEEQS